MGERYDSLRGKQRAFVDLYFKNNMNGAAAARELGYAHPRRRAYELVTNSDIKTAIEEKLSEQAMPAVEVIARLASQARGTMGDFLDTNGGEIALDLEKAKQAGQLHLIRKITHNVKTYKDENGKQCRESQTNIELYDAQKALEKIGKTFGLFVEKREHTGKVSWLSVDGDDYESA